MLCDHQDDSQWWRIQILYTENTESVIYSRIRRFSLRTAIPFCTDTMFIIWKLQLKMLQNSSVAIEDENFDDPEAMP